MSVCCYLYPKMASHKKQVSGTNTGTVQVRALTPQKKCRNRNVSGSKEKEM
jgi:hypothetical protein